MTVTKKKRDLTLGGKGEERRSMGKGQGKKINLGGAECRGKKQLHYQPGFAR